MKFRNIHQVLIEDSDLTNEYEASHPLGVLRIGTAHIFFRAGLKQYVLPFSEITRCFRRVRSVPARLCCGKGDFGIESLVICTKDGEVAEIQLPGKRAAQAAFQEMKEKLPGVAYGACGTASPKDAGEP